MMMKEFLGLTWDQAVALALAKDMVVEEHEETEYEDAWIELTWEGLLSCGGYALQFEDGVVDYYEELGWL